MNIPISRLRMFWSRLHYTKLAPSCFIQTEVASLLLPDNLCVFSWNYNVLNIWLWKQLKYEYVNTWYYWLPFISSIFNRWYINTGTWSFFKGLEIRYNGSRLICNPHYWSFRMKCWCQQLYGIFINRQKYTLNWQLIK